MVKTHGTYKEHKEIRHKEENHDQGYHTSLQGTQRLLSPELLVVMNEIALSKISNEKKDHAQRKSKRPSRYS
jgi:hypothetical protein